MIPSWSYLGGRSDEHLSQDRSHPPHQPPAATPSGFVPTSDGVTLAVRDIGGCGAPIVMAHAAGFHGLVWAPLAEPLRAVLRCISFDHRGHGDSGLPPGGEFDWRSFGLDVLAVIEGLGLGRPFGLGHSMGGTALLLAEQKRPGTFRALYCFEPVIVPADPPLGADTESWLARAARRRREIFPSREEALRSYVTKMACIAPAVLDCYVEAGFEDLAEGGVRLKCRANNEALIYEMGAAHDCFVRLPEIACPVTLARGEASDVSSQPLFEAMTARLARARITTLSGLGHLGPLEDPRAVSNDVVQAFFGSEAKC